MDPVDHDILVRFRYLQRQRIGLDAAAPIIGSVAGHTGHLEWRFGGIGKGPDQGPAASSDRPVTVLRALLHAHQAAIEWVEGRVNEGVTTQYRLAQLLADTLLLYQKGAEELARRLDRLREAGYRGL